MKLGTHPDTGKVSELSVGVDVHLDNAVLDGSLDLLLGRARATVENQEARKQLEPSVIIMVEDKLTEASSCR